MTYNDWCERFHFAQDMNGDLVFSISDVWLMTEYVLLLPAKIVVNFVKSKPEWARFFEINCLRDWLPCCG